MHSGFSLVRPLLDFSGHSVEEDMDDHGLTIQLGSILHEAGLLHPRFEVERLQSDCIGKTTTDINTQEGKGPEWILDQRLPCANINAMRLFFFSVRLPP
eukprot:6246664-Amphidinium_carterae.1